MSERPIEGLEPIAQAYRRVGEGEPPSAVDATVRARAREAARRRRASAWTLPAALAATVLIAFSLVLNLQQEENAPGPAERPSRDEPAPASIVQDAAPAAPPAAPPAAAPAAAPMADSPAEKSTARSATAAAEGAVAPLSAREESPEEWLELIEALEAAGRHDQARAERQRLEAAYPGWLAQHASQRD